MPVFVVGLNYRTAPLDLLERLAVNPELRPKATAHLRKQDRVDEVVILSTCNRVEVYASLSRYHEGASQLRRALAEIHHLDQGDVTPYLYDYLDDAAVAHLFGVTAGLESLVVGEAQILTQVREAFAAARAEGAVGPVLGALFQRAIKAGRQARTRTGIGGQLRSTVSEGLRVAEHQLGDLAGRSALVVGAGQMGRLATRTLRARGLTDVVVANRTAERGERLAADLGIRAVPLEGIEAELARVDLVVASTAATTPTITTEAVGRALADRDGRPLVVLDLGVPRDVETGVRLLPRVVLADLDGLRALVETGGGADAAEVARARALVASEVDAFMTWQRQSRLGPTIQALRDRAEDLRRQELAKAAPRLAELTEREAATVEAVTRGIVNKLLHDPIVRGKALAAGPDGEQYARLLRELYAVGEHAPAPRPGGPSGGGGDDPHDPHHLDDLDGDPELPGSPVDGGAHGPMAARAPGTETPTS